MSWIGIFVILIGSALTIFGIIYSASLLSYKSDNPTLTVYNAAQMSGIGTLTLSFGTSLLVGGVLYEVLRSSAKVVGGRR
jgi:predicted phage tail protein